MKTELQCIASTRFSRSSKSWIDLGSKSGRDAASQPCALSEGGCHGPAWITLFSKLKKEATIEVIKIPWRTSRTLRRKITNRIIKAADNADALVFAVVNRSHVSVVQNVLRRTRQVPSAMVSLASPYFPEFVPQVGRYVCAYSYQPVAQDAVADGLLGMLRMDGRLPVSLPGYYQAGHRAGTGVTAALRP